MSITLRIILIAAAVLTLVFVVRRIRASKIQLEDSIFWICSSVLILVASVVPQVFVWGASAIGIESPANLVFLLFIFILLIKCFSMSVAISQTNAKVKELTQQLAIERLERHRGMNSDAAAKTSQNEDESQA